MKDKTIRLILERLNNGGYVGYGGVDQALKEIKTILDSASKYEIKLSDDIYDRDRVLEILDEYNEYFQSNINKLLGK